MITSTVTSEWKPVPHPGPRRCALTIGGVSLGISVEFANGLILPPEHREFQTDLETCDIEMECQWVDSLAPAQGKRIFDSGATWRMYSDAPGFSFDFTSPIFGRVPYKRLRVNDAFSQAQLLLNGSVFSWLDGSCLLEYPMDELLITHRLAYEGGVEIHGCGLLDSEAGGILFVGHSGAGKSTTTSLWNSLRKVNVLSDDRIILRKEAGNVAMHGTPWHGEAGFATAKRAPVRGIFVIEHGRENQITALPPSRAAGELFARCFLPFHDSGALRCVLKFLHEMTAIVPCYRYSFSPDASAVERILEFLHKT